MTIDEYVYQLSLMISWFKDHENDLPKYYEFTMRELITIHSFNQLMKFEVLQQNTENNLIRLIEDNKIFIKDHLERSGVIKSKFDIIDNYL